jgi:signal transduction histidine kinase
MYISQEMDSRVLQALNDQLIKKNKEMEQLVARVAHELLTPITSLMMTADELLDNYESLRDTDRPIYSNEQLLSFAQRISRSSRDLKTQASNILNHFSAMSNNAKTTLIDVSQIVENLLDEFAPEATQNNVQLVQTSQGHTSVLASEDTIKTVCRNIISNAIKFTAANDTCQTKTVEVSVTTNGKQVELIVSDTGIGMKPDFINSKLFLLGSRGENATSKEVRGYGVGLSTVKLLLDNLGGVITYQSLINKGTKVCVSFPKDQDEEFFI